MPSPTAADWPCSAESAISVAPRWQGGCADRVLAGDDDRQLDRRSPRERLQHVGDHRARELQAQLLVDALAEPLLGEGEALDGQDRGGAHG